MRLMLIHSFGALSTGAAPGAAEAVFSVRATKGFARIADLRPVFYDLGYWLGAEYDFARASLDGAGTGEFSFRDLVAWWAQSARAFLMLLDDAAFKARHACVHVCGTCRVLFVAAVLNRGRLQRDAGVSAQRSNAHREGLGREADGARQGAARRQPHAHHRKGVPRRCARAPWPLHADFPSFQPLSLFVALFPLV